MALSRNRLFDQFERIFNVQKSPEVKSIPQCGSLLTDAIVQYLGSAKLSGLKVPGIGLIPAGISPVPGPDPMFAAVTPASSNSSIIRSGLVSAMQSNITGVDRFSTADSAFATYVVSTYTTFSIGHYIATGASVPGPINLSSVLGVQYDSSEEIASKLADHIHRFFTSCVFTGVATGTGPPIGPFTTPGPHVGKLQ